MSECGKTRLRFLGILLAVTIIATGCGGGGGGGGAPTAPSNPDAPVQLNLQVNPLTSERAGTEVQYLITITVQDRNGDIVGGRSELRSVTANTTQSFEITAVTGDCITQCTFQGLLTLTKPPPGRIDFVHTTIDKAGNRSNEIPFFVTIAAAELPREAVPGEFGVEWKPTK